MYVSGFRTAIPFGYLFFFGGLLALVIGGLYLVIAGALRRPRERAGIACGTFMVALGGWLFWSAAGAGGNLDLNASYSSETLVGKWEQDGSILVLNKDGTFVCSNGGECTTFGERGRWNKRRGGNDIEFVSSGKTIERAPVSYNEEIWFTDLSGDPDMWNGRLMFRQIREPANHLIDRPAAR
ncbi:MAG: hypothetical protein COV48_09530 [Elusimicrobia bacterium CG11_big_fil_rev_8_21_14_0_20_64_6]|nr:MAG: hypothetical protein COV48_09530 [Elusimicrobia bacterium CG11_big_fil_rev_8_21_14_0_20_64_6]